MSTKPCIESDGSKIIAQTLFLGASVINFNTSMGWGGQPSQLTVTLIEDSSGDRCLIGSKQDRVLAEQLPSSPVSNANLVAARDSDRFAPDHYHSCSGDSCYVNRQGSAFNRQTMDISERMVPGKVYYEFFPTNSSVPPNGTETSNVPKCFLSKYWYNPDPGFFGQPNRIKIDNTYSNSYDGPSAFNRGYDIIDTPVLFKMGNFTFGGLVQSWNRQLGQGGVTYTVTINSMQTLLNSCYVIVGAYAGAIYSKLQGSTAIDSLLSYSNNSLFGGPRNYTGHAGVDYFGKIYEGNIPNVFNVYGFLESFGKDGFGGANLNSEGISANLIIDSLSVLTGAMSNGKLLTYHSNDPSFTSYGSRVAFSPFGRILAKTMQENDTYQTITPAFKRFGVIPPSSVLQDKSTPPTLRCQFLLDLSEIPRLPNDFRISGPVLSITDLLNLIAEKACFDYYVDLIPLYLNGAYHHVIKVKTISRLVQPRTNSIENTIKNLECNGFALSSTSIGKEKNETSARSLIVGGAVQRLYQAKSLRLAYTQSNYIFDPTDGAFIDYMQLGRVNNSFQRAIANGITKQFHFGKTRVPSPIDLHNPTLSPILNPTYAGIYTHNNEIKKANGSLRFEEPDPNWTDNPQIGSAMPAKAAGNYHKANIILQESPDQSTWGLTYNQRFFPLWKDIICPFFGYVNDNELDIKLDGSNNDFRRIRPVWFDTWTGQIAIMIQVNELPETSVNLQGMFDTTRVVSDVLGKNRTIFTSHFLLTESEIRAALAGFDEFVVYCLSKTYANNLIDMLRNAYIAKDKAKYVLEGLDDAKALAKAIQKHAWFWRLANKNNFPGGNAAGPFRRPIAPAPAQPDGTYSIDNAALGDLRILHGFVSKIGEFYGKKYMVGAPYLTAYKEINFSKIALPTAAGTAYVFGGGGDIKYSYEPTNDGAWEEYGNIIDDCIAVGSKEWYSIIDDVGKISPILAYNANDAFDYVKYNMCKMAQADFENFTKNTANPIWSFKLWDVMKDKRDTVCDEGKYTFPCIDYSSLAASDYIIVPVSGVSSLPAIYNQTAIPNWDPASFAPLSYGWIKSQGKDAFGKNLFHPSGVQSEVKKLFVKADVQENFEFIDPENYREPRIIVSSPGIALNSITQETQSDPTRSILANVVIEDVSIYVRSTDPASRDNNWIDYMMSYVYSLLYTNKITGNLASSANRSTTYAQLHQKMAHPLFAGIPLKSNAHTYGPWTNYPYLEYLNDPESVFPSGNSVTNKVNPASQNLSPGANINVPYLICSTGTYVMDHPTAKKAVDNWIMPTIVDSVPEYTPWNYGGMAYLDIVAMNDARSRVNYQNILESAQIDIPGLPIFNLGGSFTYGEFASIPSGVLCSPATFIDTKYNINNPLDILPKDLPILYAPPISETVSETIEYQLINVVSYPNYGIPIITNIQTNVSTGGITTTYSFRTYTRKLGFFNKEFSDNIKNSNLDRIRRSKQIADSFRQTSNAIFVQQKALQQQRLSKDSNININSKLFGWSPVKVLVGQSAPYLDPPYAAESVHPNISYLPGASMPSNPGTRFKIYYGSDLGHDSSTWISETAYLTANTVVPKLAENMRHRTDVGLFEEKEAIAQINQDYGLQGMMSLDGIFSPVSFYPTLKNSTYHFALYDTKNCPFCNGTKKISISYQTYLNTGYGAPSTVDIYCDKCKNLEDQLTVSLKSNTTNKASSQSLETLPPYIVTSGTDLSALLAYGITKGQTATGSTSSSSDSSAGQAGISIPINMTSLQPIVVPYGEFKNPNVQSYVGVHPDGDHADLSIGAYSPGLPRTFFDRCRHSIEIVGRGAMNPTDITTSRSLINAYSNNNFYNEEENTIFNTDYYDKDIRLKKHLEDRGVVGPSLLANNQRFLSLRGPLVLHAWGYDLEGYPVPNAADEPYEFDIHGRPKRFKVKIKEGFPKPTKFKDLKIGDTYKYNSIEYVKTKILENDTDLIYEDKVPINNNTEVNQTDYEDDLSDPGGFDPGTSSQAGDRITGYRGSIISKTQQFDTITKKWSAKKKLKEFYLNWAERPDIWPVGPIDLRWDADRRVWATKSDASSIYKMVYVTLEEDLVKDDDVDETYPARGFLDDIEYSNQPLPDGFRRLVYVKDRGGYTAPRGAKLLCRYSSDTNFYEPITKQSFVVGGLLSSPTTAVIEMSYVLGKKRGEPVPTMLVSFDNPFEFGIAKGNKGLFTFMNGKWTLTATKEP